MEVYMTALQIMGNTGKERLDTILSRRTKDETEEGTNFNIKAYSSQAANAIQQAIYGLTNADELMAEVFSNPQLMVHLATIKLNETIMDGVHKGERKSLLYKWYEQLTGYVKQQLKTVYRKEEDYQKAANALDYFMDFIADYDSEFLKGNLQRKTDYSKTPFYGAWMKDQAETQEDLYDLMSLAVKDKKEGKEPIKGKLNFKIINNVVGTLSKRKDIQTLKDVRDYIARINKHLGLEKQLGDLYAKAVLKGVIKERLEVVEAKKVQKNATEYGRKQPQYKDFKFEQDVEHFAAADIDLMNKEQRRDYISGFTKLVHNGIPTQKEYNTMINFGMKEVAKKELMPITKDLHKTYVTGLEQATNPALFTRIISKFKTIVGDKLLKNIYGGLMLGFSRATTESMEHSKQVNELAAKYNLNHKELSGVAIYGSIFSTVADPANKLEWMAEVDENADHALESAENKLKSHENENYFGKLSLDEIKQELEEAKELVAKIKKLHKMDGILSKGQQAIYDKIREFNTKNEDNFERNASMWGDDYVRRFNYFQTLTAGKAVGDYQSLNILDERAKNIFEAVEASEGNPDKSMIPGKAAGAKNARENAKGYFYEYDPTVLAEKHSKDVLLDMYVSAEFKKLNRLMKDNAFRTALGPKLIKSFTRNLQHIASSQSKQTETQSKLGRSVWKIRDNLYVAAIATSGQFATQAVSGVANAVILTSSLNPKTGLGTKNLAKALSAAGQVVYNRETDNKMNQFYSFMVKNSLGTNIRNAFLDKYYKPSQYKSKLAGRAGKLAQLGTNITEKPTRWGDEFAAATVFFSTYFDAGGTIEKPNPEAIIRAEAMVGVLQNMSDVNFNAEVFRPKSKAARNFMMTFFAFKMFSINAELSLLYALKNSLHSSEARKVATAQLASVVAYRVTSTYAIGKIYGLAASALAAAWGSEGDDEEEKKNFSWWKDIFYQGMWDILLGSYSPSVLDGFMRWWFNNTEGFGTLSKDNGEEFDQFVDSPIFSKSTPAKAVFENLVGPGTNDILKSSVEFMEAYGNKPEDDSDWEKAAKKKDKQDLWVLGFAALVYGGMSGLPFRGDVKRILEKTKGQIKSNNYVEKNSGGGGSGESNEEEFVFPDGPSEATEGYFEEQ